MDTKTLMPGEDVIAGIRNDIAAYEIERAKAYAQVQWRVPVFLGALLVLAALLAYAFNSFASPYEQWFSTPHVFLYVATFVAAFFVYKAAMSPATRLKQSFRDRVLPIVFGFVENLHYANGTTPGSFDRLPKQATGSFGRQTFDDVISGKYEGFPFELFETRLSTGGKSDQTIFKGVVMGFETLTPFPGLLVAAKRGGTVSNFFRDMFGGSGLQMVESGIASLDETYEFHTDNPGAARTLVTGKLAKALQWLAEAWPGEPARIALEGRDGFLLLPFSRNFFELPDISTPIDYKAHIEPIVADMVSLLATAALVRQVGAPDEQPVAGNQA